MSCNCPTPTGISAMRLKQLAALIAQGNEDRFYDWPEWDEARDEALRLDRGECYLCRTRHKRFRKAVLVHHVKHLKDRPDLALSLFDPDTGERQLVGLCRGCHEDEHPERRWRGSTAFRSPVTEERWD